MAPNAGREVIGLRPSLGPRTGPHGGVLHLAALRYAKKALPLALRLPLLRDVSGAAAAHLLGTRSGKSTNLGPLNS